MAQVAGVDWRKLERPVQETLEWAFASELDRSVGTRGLLIGLIREGGGRSEPSQLLEVFGVPPESLFTELQAVQKDPKIDPDVKRPSELKDLPPLTSNATRAIEHARKFHGDARFGPRELFGGVLQVHGSTGYRGLVNVLGDDVVRRLRSTYAEYLAAADEQAYGDFLRHLFPAERQAREPAPTPKPAPVPAFLVGVRLPNGESASGIVLNADGAVLTAWPSETARDGEFRVYFDEAKRARARRAGFGLVELEVLEPMAPLRPDQLPRPAQLASAAPPERLFVHSMGPSDTLPATEVGFVQLTDEGKQVRLSGELPPAARGAPVLLPDGRLYAIVTGIEPDGQIAATSAFVLELLTTYDGRALQPVFVGSLGGAANDGVTVEDQLGFEHYVQAFAELIDSPYTVPPITIGIYGAWGMGKTFLLQNIAARLQDEAFRKRPNLSDRERPRVHVVSFNAWEYSANEIIWPGLVRKIMSTLERETNPSRVGRFLLRLRRNLARQIRVARGRIIGAATLLAGALVVAVWQDRFDAALLGGVIAALGVGGVVKIVSDAVADPLGQWFTSLFEQRSYGGEIGYMEEIKRDLGRLQQELKKHHGRVVVMIDDLDRCEPDKAVEVLQAVNLLIDFDSFIVCLGIDARVITRAVERHYQDLLAEAGASGYEYLDKIVQIPFRIPEPTGQEIEDFLTAQLGDPEPEPEPESQGRLVRALAAAPPDEVSAPEPAAVGNGDLGVASPPAVEPGAARAPVAFGYTELQAFTAMTRYLRPNPRHLKRLVNVYRLVRSLAAIRGDVSVSGDPRATVRWLVLAAQWPYAASQMLERFSELRDDWGGRIPAQPPPGDPLVYLLGEVRPRLSQKRRRELDEDANLLDDLLASEEGRLTWEQLDVIRAYTVNFNPAVEEVRLTDKETAAAGA
jgi:Cdc6-like AAA superfamily ATPase